MNILVAVALFCSFAFADYQVFYGERTLEVQDGLPVINVYTEGVQLRDNEVVILNLEGKAFRAVYHSESKGRIQYLDVRDEMPLGNGSNRAEVGRQATHGGTGQGGQMLGVSMRIGGAALGSGVTAGVATWIYRSTVMSAGNTRELNELKSKVQAQIERGQRAQSETAKIEYGLIDQIVAAKQSFPGMERAAQFDWTEIADQKDKYDFRTTEPIIRADLEENRRVLNSIIPFSPLQEDARDLGLSMNSLADESYASGDRESGSFFLGLANGFADLAIGLNPATGFLKDLYEATTGRGLISGEPLDEMERGLAIFGVVTAGIGSKVVVGLKAFEKLKRFKLVGPGIEKAVAWANNFFVRTGEIKLVAEYENALKAAKNFALENGLDDWLPDLAKSNPKEFNRYVELINETSNIRVPFKTLDNVPLSHVSQDLTREALDAYEMIKKDGGYLYRQGRFTERSRINKIGKHPSAWAFEFEDIGRPDFANKYGTFTNNFEFIEHGRIKRGKDFIVRKSEKGEYLNRATMRKTVTQGGALEVIVAPGDVETIRLIDIDGYVK